MSEIEAHKKANRLEQLAGELDAMCGRGGGDGNADIVCWVPGRIEALGKHTDYGGGRSLLCAVERGVCTVARARADRAIRLRDANRDETIQFDLTRDLPRAPGAWSNYPMTVARRIAMNFGEHASLRGADIVFASDLPPAAGISSSSALVVATFLVLSAVNDLPANAEYQHNIQGTHDLAGYLGSVENGLDYRDLRGHAGVGTFGGSEDQTAILCSQANALVQYSFCPVRFERQISLPPGYSFAIATSGVSAEKTGAAQQRYNEVSRRLSAVLDEWRRTTGATHESVGAALASTPAAAERIRAALRSASNAEYSAESLVARFDHFCIESTEIIPAAGDALATGDLETFGALVDRSQRGAERWLGNQIPETIALARQARALGAVAASAFGAGFGGSVWALVPVATLAPFCARWAEDYLQSFPESSIRSEIFATRAGPPAMLL